MTTIVLIAMTWLVVGVLAALFLGRMIAAGSAQPEPEMALTPDGEPRSEEMADAA